MKQAITLHTEKQQEREAKKIRIINKGGGRKVKLSNEDQILLTLTYFKTSHNVSIIGVSESTANDTFNYWFPILQDILPSSLLEQVKKTPVIMRLFKTEYELIVDSSEQPGKTRRV